MTSPVDAAKPPRRRWSRRLLIGVNVVVALGLLAAASGYGYLRWRYGQIDKVDLGGVLEDEEGQVMNVLLVGSDSRKGITGDAAEHFGSEQEVGGQRSDTMMVLHVDPRAEKAAILSIPRDLWVTIAGTGESGRINSAFDGGPARLIETLTNATGLEIDHYMEVDFAGFAGIVDAVGGVPVYFPTPARDRMSGLNIQQPGCVTLHGGDALAYVRSRHYQYKESGRWHDDPTSDFGRMARQQDFMRRVMRQAISKGARNPVVLNRLVGAGIDNLTVDKDLSTSDLRKLGTRFRSLDPAAVDMVTLPTVGFRTRGGADVLRLKQPDAGLVIGLFNGVVPSESEQPPASLLPSSVSVRVLNGTGVSGQAGQAAGQLQRVGFNVAGTGDAGNFGQRPTTITYGTGDRDKALLLRNHLPGGAQLQEDPKVGTVDLVLTTGSDYSGVKAPAAAAPASTAATAGSATPSTTAPAPNPVPASSGAPADPGC